MRLGGGGNTVSLLSVLRRCKLVNPGSLPFFPARKYPTLANVEKKKEEEAKRRASGQVLKTKNFRYNNL